MRLFFGIGIPDDVRARAVALQEELRATGLAASWVPPQNLHYTMKFLGDVADALQPAIVASAREAAGAVAPFSIVTRGAGAFPGTRRPRVLWAGGRTDGDGPERLSRALDQAAGVAGVAPGDRPLRLHVTLARVRATGRAPSSLEAVVSRWESVELGRFVAREVTLYRSDLGNGPARYTILERLPLSPGSS